MLNLSSITIELKLSLPYHEVMKLNSSHFSTILKCAAAYNLAWGAWVILFPNLFFDWLQMDRPNYPQIWQCVGMVVGVYGIGYWIAAQKPFIHWPIVLVGFLGKIFGPIGFAHSLILGTLPLKFGVLLITNDFIWWLPFWVILKANWDSRKLSGRGESR